MVSSMQFRPWAIHLELSQEIILEVAEALAVGEDKGARVEWIDQEIDKILKTKDHRCLA